jgi:hypothetical protein
LLTPPELGLVVVPAGSELEGVEVSEEVEVSVDKAVEELEGDPVLEEVEVLESDPGLEELECWVSEVVGTAVRMVGMVVVIVPVVEGNKPPFTVFDDVVAKYIVETINVPIVTCDVGERK